MISFQEVYDSRKEEIKKFLDMMKFLQGEELRKSDEGESAFEAFFKPKKGGIDLSYQELINIFKSNISLMLYNIIEYTVANLVDSIYDEIRIHNLSYMEVNKQIKELWKKIMLKPVNDPSSNFGTFLKKNDAVVQHIIEKRTLDMKSKESLPAGNLDGKKINETFSNHGVHVAGSNSYYRPDILEGIKKKRNDLAHGTVSFVEAVQDDSILDIENNVSIVLKFLDGLISTVKEYIETSQYRLSEK